MINSRVHPPVDARTSSVITYTQIAGNEVVMEVEELFGIELAKGCAMGGSDIIGKDFEIGLALGTGVFAEEQVGIALVRLCFLRRLMDVDLSLKARVCLTIDHIFEELVGTAVRRLMVNEHMDMCFLFVFEFGKTKERGFTVFIGECDAVVVARDGTAISMINGFEISIAFKRRAHRFQMPLGTCRWLLESDGCRFIESEFSDSVDEGLFAFEAIFRCPCIFCLSIGKSRL